jgi:fatty-acyl-CoA synthase
VVEVSEISESLLWPSRYNAASDLASVETVPLESRGLPASTYALLVRAAGRWPDHVALNVLPDAARWRTPRSLTFEGLLGEVHQYANALHALGVRRGDAVALLAPNCAELVTATLAAQLAGIAVPISSVLGLGQVRGLLERSAARVLVVAGPELAPEAWENALTLAAEGLVDTVGGGLRVDRGHVCQRAQLR